jgi:undecaprenyl diphosphate synthase
MSKDKIPRHIAIIMDGNGRWALKNALSQRVLGHETGAERVREITTECSKLGVKRLTLYAFSNENWKRPRQEIDFLMNLLRRYLREEESEIMDNNIRLVSIGRIEMLPQDIIILLETLKNKSSKNTGMVLCLALSYGGRVEILDAVKKISKDVTAGELDINTLDERIFSKYLYDPNMEDPDLLIRTGGNMRISNFLLWQISYTELYVTPVLWPDFTKGHLHEAIEDFSHRERRFGGI